MKETEIRGMVADVKEGKLSRRDFVNRMLAVGVTAPMSWHILDFHGVAQAQSLPRYTPTKAGGGGPLKILLWQAPTLLNPHFAIGTKDQEASRVFYEPLAGWDTDGNLVPILAAEIPSRENGGVSADGLTVTWKLKPGVKWHDGKPFTADDCLFTWQYAGDPATAATTIGTYQNIKVEKVNDLTVKITFSQPTPFWADAFVGAAGMILPKHVFEQFKGAASRDAPANLKPVGTGAYKFVDFKPGDMLRGERNTEYHIANQPFSTRSRSRAAVTLSRPPARSSRPASSTMPGTCRWRTRSSCAWSAVVAARPFRSPAATSSSSCSTSPIRGPRSTASVRA